jgi:soluble lytic murein transglycosylase
MIKRLFPFLIFAIMALSCSTPVAVQIFPTATPAETATPTIPPTPTATPTSPPTPTPPPAVRVEIAENALFLGSYEFARKEFQNVQGTTNDPELQAAAAAGIGQAYFMAGNYPLAIKTLKAVVADYPPSTHVANAYYFLGRSLSESQLHDQAADAYSKYIELRPGALDAYMQGLRGDAYMSAGNPGAAVAAYQASIEAPQEGTTIWIELKLGRAYAAAGDQTNAIKKYLEIYEKSSSDYARAQANLLLGQLYLRMEMPEQAYARFLDSVYNFPKVYDSHAGLVVLVNNGVPVNELYRGMVNYHAGQFGLAIEAINRYLLSNNEQLATAYHYRALSQLALNEPAKASADWDIVIENYPLDALWSTAWEQKAYAMWAYLGDFEGAASTLLRYVELAPNSPLSSEFMFQAARIRERNRQLGAAAETWERMIDTYPSASKSYRGLFLAGVTYYRIENLEKAHNVFQRAVVLANQPDELAAAYLWVGKVRQTQGDLEGARAAWQQSAQSDPTGYYSERANELLNNRAPFSVETQIDLGIDLAQERLQAADWLRATFEIPAGTDLNGPGELAGDPRFTRGTAFWELGLYEAGRNEFEALRKSILTDPVLNFKLLPVLHNMGLYRSAVMVSRQILDLANLDDLGTLKAPVYFNHIRFGIYYKDLVLQASQKENLHPLFILSVMRQESMYEGFAISSAGARGLMQIMPATGQEIATGMNWPANYTSADLYRPEISIPMGARYLARQRDYFNKDLYATLAAYNGGPGNMIRWNELSGGDQDLLLEVIRAEETRKYIMQISEFFNIYRIIYERGM